MNHSILFDQIHLCTERLLLRPLIPTDAAALFEVFSDAKVMRYWSGIAWSSIDQAHEKIAQYSKSLKENESIGLGICYAQTNAVIGTCSLFQLDAQCRRAEIGYGMASTSWGKGYMHEALTTLINFAFEELNLNRIEADIDPRNEASLHSVERLGFIQEGHLRERWIVGTEISDSIIYGLLRRDWLAKKPSN
jgi:ribosomal-protein-alanine N-acetyltransferase